MFEECAVEHRKLPSVLSYVMSIMDAGETYSIQKIELLKFGGNDRFKSYLDSYKVEDESSPLFGKSIFSNMPITQKYTTNAAKYYRHKIQVLARQQTPTLECPQTLEEASAIIEDDIEDWIFVANDEEEYFTNGAKPGE